MSLEHATHRKGGPGAKKSSGSGDDKKIPVPRAAYTIPEFCEAHRISEAFYFKLRNLGKGPREGRALSKCIISMESAAEWRKAREADAEMITTTQPA